MKLQYYKKTMIMVPLILKYFNIQSKIIYADIGIGQLQFDFL